MITFVSGAILLEPVGLTAGQHAVRLTKHKKHLTIHLTQKYWLEYIAWLYIITLW